MKLSEAVMVAVFAVALGLNGTFLARFLGDSFVVYVAVGFMIGFVTARTLYYK